MTGSPDPEDPRDDASAAPRDAHGDADVVEVPIDGTLDLHSFHPRDLRTLVPDYLAECHKRGITSVRLIHGRGTGSVMRGVHALLERSPLVVRFRLGGPRDGGAGATLVDLRGPTDDPTDGR